MSNDQEQTATGNGTSQATVFERMAEPFPSEVVEWRAQTVDRTGKRALALAYIDARSVMARLDEVVGPQNWQDRYREEGGRMVCELSIRIDGEWIVKSDGSGDTNFEAEKGGISGAFKRAAVKWGIGRYLYDVDALWADCKAREAPGQGGKKKWVFVEWTQAGEKALAEALRRAPGPRSTGRPFSVDKMLELIRGAKNIGDLRTIHEQHWATIPMPYRREVLEAKDAQKRKLQQSRDEEPSGEKKERRK
jgi:hypothetical protein